MLKSTNKNYVSIILNAQGKILPYDLFFDNSEAVQWTSFLVLHVQCSVNSYAARKITLPVFIIVA